MEAHSKTSGDSGHRPVRRDLQATDPTTQFARRLRKEMSRAEVLLWTKLRRRQAGGFLFNRQRPFGKFISDFYCHEARLVVEVDGPHHEERRDEDEIRDRWMEERGLMVARFTTEAVERELSRVVGEIVAACRERTRSESGDGAGA